MCGIAGVFHKQALKEVIDMIDKVSHRGPDGQGIKVLPGGTLGHSRLAIIDVDGGHQPMGFDDTWISFNGEIYNYLELAKEHLDNIRLETNSDTEVIIRLFQKYGPNFVHLLRGMFAFAIVRGNECFMARDPLGIKPIYYSETRGGFYFASEIKALGIITNDIHEFPAGTCYHSHYGWNEYFQVAPKNSVYSDESSAIESLRNILAEAVNMRMIADVPVGISLSGGLDSSIVAMLANRETQHLHSFAVGMADSEDLAAARKMAILLGNQHHERIFTEQEMRDVLPKVIYHLESFDPALVRSSVPNYFLAEMASKYVKVILTGEGADEIYAGYDYLRNYDDPDLLQEEMIHITNSLHNTNLQRADRIAMAFGLESRVPFLDVKSVEFGLGLPAKWKAHRERPAKYLLRQAFRAELPEEITNRPKQKFSKGAGSFDVISKMVESAISDEELKSERERLIAEWSYHLQNKEALYYYRIAQQFFPDQWLFPTMGSSRSL